MPRTLAEHAAAIEMALELAAADGFYLDYTCGDVVRLLDTNKSDPKFRGGHDWVSVTVPDAGGVARGEARGPLLAFPSRLV